MPDISPSRGEIGRTACWRHSSSVGDWRKQRPSPISPLEGEMSGRTEGGAKELGLSKNPGTLTP
ncbi:hypothetical protein EN947_21920 [Mesorhizobium sp. M7A.F.Ca.US.003.02.2.1]|nr:hypothetical protein EN949_34575 [Mesorhizobium sp. M7A.F.Ca.US.007.01.2.1]RUZ56252.1 hypothetical protein EN950_26785 [Mesorhizobium sp. M7A.F.Ca.US.007.01.1.1]RUZ78184.1 hypothetical protein EN947_21920 [Mesorhizobium sp. M7A.F.Ca.US.003.02.2.1]